ncbi:sensor histidine kinase [Acrocarpospora macrocephala]|uniref:histidine kinase n=1 Tax=Acrocarpospora macrocephala TaxID=150177 RepID=A0A5M3X3S4_9ACTN|nr:sensor domain-containing protein [Acrocarpospora macrocephala]GES14301.1 histidine kinase [Acrocarpospora macrocephala]
MHTRRPGHGWRAMTRGPLRFLASSWPWRSLAYVLTGWIVATVWVAAVTGLIAVPAFGLGVLLAGIPLAAVERWRLRLVDTAPAPSPHPRLVRPGLWGWIGARFGETATWRELGYALLFALGLAWLDAVVGLLFCCALYLIGFPALVVLLPDYQPDRIFGLVAAELPQAFALTAVGVLTLPVVMYLITAYAAGRATLTRTLVSHPFDAEVMELTRSRARIMDAMDAQRRRIERDLHDGAQQRLTGVIMTLGLAKLQLADAPPVARDLVGKAYEQARATLGELRDLVHGIHPQILTDRGLPAAVAELAEHCAVPVQVDIDLPERPPGPVEATAWFVIGEALTNVTRHSNARQVWIGVWRQGRLLVLEVRDDGTGGADPARGSGLMGLADRVSVLNGRITLTSPPGGPTVLGVELPCA